MIKYHIIYFDVNNIFECFNVIFQININRYTAYMILKIKKIKAYIIQKLIVKVTPFEIHWKDKLSRIFYHTKPVTKSRRTRY